MQSTVRGSAATDAIAGEPTFAEQTNTTQTAADRGSISALTAVYVLIALVATLIVASSADLYLANKRLYSVADAAALAASGTAEISPQQTPQPAPQLTITPSRAKQAAQTQLTHFGDAYQLVDLRVDGDRVTVTVSVEWTNPFTGQLVTPTQQLRVTVTSRAVLDRVDGG